MASKPIPILMYHQIDEAQKGTPFRSLSVRPASFARQMWLLNLLGYKGLSMHDLMPYLRGEKTGKVVGITFDDGYLNNLENALPSLQKYAFTATVYAVSQKQSNDWDAKHNVPQKPLMTDAQFKEWIAAGQEVGAHGRHHVSLKEVSAQEAQEEIVLCKSDLEARLDVPVEHFCYPYGQYTPETAEQVQQAGFLTATTVERRRVEENDSLFELPRVYVGRHHRLLTFWSKLVFG